MVEIAISENGLTATAKSIEPRTTAEEILAALAEAGVVEGRQTSAIINAVSEAQSSKKPVLDVVVAEGTPAHFKVPPQLVHKPRGEDEKLPTLGTFKQLLGVERPEEVLKAAKGMTVLAAAEGDLLAAKVDGEIEPGKSVKGEEIRSIGGDQVSPQFTPGPGVTLSDGEFRAKFPGYVGILDGQIAVLAPFWISPDEMVAAFVNLPRLPGSANYTVKEVSSSLSAAGIKVGVVEERLNALGKGLEAGTVKKVLIPVAAGMFPKQAVDASVEFSIAHESQSGTVSKDGSINLRERSGFPSVAEGDLLATTIPPVLGTPGSTVKGREIDVVGPDLIELVAGDNVRIEEAGEVQRIYSEINGGVSVQKSEKMADDVTTIQYTLSARDVAQIAGNVDYDTGNINYNGNVEIKGTILSGFSVKATGDVAVLESVENAVEIEAGGTVTVKQGIVGEKTKIVAKGGVEAKFIQDARIVAGGDVVADSYIRTANVQTETVVNVTGGGSSSGIIGGETWALNAIVSKNIGAEGTTSTLVCVGVLPTLFEEYNKNKEEADKASQTKLALMKALGIQKLDLEVVAKLVAKAPHKKEAILDYLKKAQEAEQTEKTHRDEMSVLAGKMAESVKSAYVDVTSTAFHKIRIRIGDTETVLNENLTGIRFRLNKGDQEAGIGWVPISEAEKE